MVCYTINYMAGSENPDLSIIILNFNVRDLLLKCLESVFQSKGKLDRWQVIVVDNASDDGSVEVVKKKYSVFSMDSHYYHDREVMGSCFFDI